MLCLLPAYYHQICPNGGMTLWISPYTPPCCKRGGVGGYTMMDKKAY